MSRLASIVNYPERGHYGNANWRGNTSGKLIIDIIDTFKPNFFVDVCEGSGTSADCCKEKNIKYVGLDLHKGQDFTHDYVLQFLNGVKADVVFSHPPYHDMILYKDDPRDTSRCKSVNEFLEKSQLMLLNQREATADDKFYMTLIGDQRKNGEYFSFQADFQKLMPRNELHNVIIKKQNNMMSNKTNYSGNFVPIEHEYLLIWKKKSKSVFHVGFEIACDTMRNVATTWRNVIRVVMMKLGRATLPQIYAEVEAVAGNLIQTNSNYKAKIRQKLQEHYFNVQRGVWSI